MANSPARSVIDVGSVIADTYKIEALIGRGGMGAVFVASHARLPGKKVAIKLLHTEIHDGDVMARFRREAEIASRLGHPNIVAVHDFNIMPDGTPYLVLEYLEGQTLAQKIKDGPIPLDQVLSIVRQIGSALAAAHREGIVHRDLKPQNIFLIPTDVDGRIMEVAKVLDFGISKIVGSQTVKTLEHTLLGTPQYMAPEQATGQHDSVDQRTDVFALGAIVYEMLNGHPAFSGASIPEVVFKVVYEQPAPMSATVPTTIADAVKQAMSKPADDRYPSVNGFVEALTGMPLTNLRPSMSQMPEVVGFATGSKRVSNQDALANTMGSGDYTPPPRALLATGVPARGSAPTVESGSRPFDIGIAATSSPGTAAAPISATSGPGVAATVAAPAAPAAKKPVALIAAVLAAAVATGAVVFLVLRGPGETTPADKVEVATAMDPKAAGLTRSPEVAGSASDLGGGSTTGSNAASAGTTTGIGSGGTTGSGGSSTAAGTVGVTPNTGANYDENPDPNKPDPKKPDPKKPPVIADSPLDRPATDDDPDVRAAIDSAEAALRDGNFTEANRIAIMVTNNQDARPGQVSRAYAIKGVIACRRDRDGEKASTAFRAVGARAHKKRVLDACSEVGIEINSKR